MKIKAIHYSTVTLRETQRKRRNRKEAFLCRKMLVDKCRRNDRIGKFKFKQGSSLDVKALAGRLLGNYV